VSPFSWLALRLLREYRSLWNIDILLSPVVGFNMQSNAKNSTRALIQAKNRYLTKEAARLCTMIGLPFEHYRGEDAWLVMSQSERCGKFLAAVHLIAPQYELNLAITIADSWWLHGQSIIVIEECWRDACTLCGIDSTLFNTLLQYSQSDHVVQLLRSNEDFALKSGCFAEPSFIVPVAQKTVTSNLHPLNSKQHVEVLFGGDHMEMIAYTLNKPYYGSSYKHNPSNMSRSKL